MIKKYFLGILFALGLIYILYPGPTSINDFPPIPDSKKSIEEGDTIQIPNVAAYYSFWRREEITKFYRGVYEKKSFWPFIIPSIRLNHPPEYAYNYVRDQLKGTFLEEYTYPLRDSIFVNGLDKWVLTELEQSQHGFYNDTIHIDGVFYNSKTTLRFYNSSLISRIIVYLGIWIVSIYLTKLTFKSWRKY